MVVAEIGRMVCASRLEDAAILCRRPCKGRNFRPKVATRRAARADQGYHQQPIASSNFPFPPRARRHAITIQAVETYQTGKVVGAGTYFCLDCGFRLALAALDAIPECPHCGSRRFRRASLFEHPETINGETAEHATIDVAADLDAGEPAWLPEVRTELEQPGHFLAFEDGGEVEVVALHEGWSRIGRSATADIRLDDPTVSRRHALIVKTPEGELRILDDRSLNGVYVNGEQIEWGSLADGDELAIGRYRLFLIEAVPSPVSSRA